VDGGNNSESREMDGRGVVREKPDDYIARPHEMPVPPAELACTSRSSEAE
jgi:hypothetical protein